MRLFSQWRLVRDFTWMAVACATLGAGIFLDAESAGVSVARVETIEFALLVVVAGVVFVIAAVWSEFRFGQLERMRRG